MKRNKLCLFIIRLFYEFKYRVSKFVCLFNEKENNYIISKTKNTNGY